MNGNLCLVLMAAMMASCVGSLRGAEDGDRRIDAAAVENRILGKWDVAVVNGSNGMTRAGETGRRIHSIAFADHKTLTIEYEDAGERHVYSGKYKIQYLPKLAVVFPLREGAGEPPVRSIRIMEAVEPSNATTRLVLSLPHDVAPGGTTYRISRSDKDLVDDSAVEMNGVK